MTRVDEKRKEKKGLKKRSSKGTNRRLNDPSLQLLERVSDDIKESFAMHSRLVDIVEKQHSTNQMFQQDFLAIMNRMVPPSPK